jgi:hypothetical protein
MTRFTVTSCFLVLSLLSVHAHAADEICGTPHGGQFAAETLCATHLLMPDGSKAGAALLDAIPDQYPWIIRQEDLTTAPSLLIKVDPADAAFASVSILNGYSPYDTTGAERTPFARYARARDVLIETAAGHAIRQTLADNQDLQTIALPGPEASGWVRLTVLSTYPGETELVAVRWFSIAWEADM